MQHDLVGFPIFCSLSFRLLKICLIEIIFIEDVPFLFFVLLIMHCYILNLYNFALAVQECN